MKNIKNIYPVALSIFALAALFYFLSGGEAEPKKMVIESEASTDGAPGVSQEVPNQKQYEAANEANGSLLELLNGVEVSERYVDIRNEIWEDFKVYAGRVNANYDPYKSEKKYLRNGKEILVAGRASYTINGEDASVNFYKNGETINLSTVVRSEDGALRIYVPDVIAERYDKIFAAHNGYENASSYMADVKKRFNNFVDDKTITIENVVYIKSNERVSEAAVDEIGKYKFFKPSFYDLIKFHDQLKVLRVEGGFRDIACGGDVIPYPYYFSEGHVSEFGHELVMDCGNRFVFLKFKF